MNKLSNLYCTYALADSDNMKLRMFCELSCCNNFGFYQMMAVAVMMARSVDEEELIVVLVTILNNIRIFLLLFSQMYFLMRHGGDNENVTSNRSCSLIDWVPDQRKHMHKLVGVSDVISLYTINWFHQSGVFLLLKLYYFPRGQDM